MHEPSLAPPAVPRRARVLAPRLRRALAVPLVGAAALACGREATVEDCERIVRRIAVLELRDVVPKEELEPEVRDAQQEFRDRALRDCVGRRITENSLTCVEKATTAEQVIDDCFD